MMVLSIAEHLQETSRTLTRMAEQTSIVEQAAEKITSALQSGKKLLIFGNGGSAADAQHFAAELVARFEKERRALPAIALSTDTSVLTAISNDYSYDQVFSRQVEALAQSGDIVVAISTSGNSKSVLQAVDIAKRQKVWTIGLTGGSGGKLKTAADQCIVVPSPRTAHIQECHIAMIHAICARIEAAFATVNA